MSFDLIAFDADDTLWHNEDAFREAEHQFIELISPYVPPGISVAEGLVATERANVSTYGYGVKAFGLSMIEAAIAMSRGTVPVPVFSKLLHLTRDLLESPVRLLPGVPEALEAVGADNTLILITKGDLVHQLRKVTTSGLQHHFDHVEIVVEKDTDMYASLLKRLGVKPDRFCMVGNSVKSDVLPVLAIGGTAVHVPYPMVWALEHVDDHAEVFAELPDISALPAWIAAHS